MFTNEFISLCQSYAAKREDVLCENIEDSKKNCQYSIEFYNYILQFRYVKKESAFVKPSSLYCTLKFGKNSVVHYHLTDIIPFLQQKTFKSCYFWNIESVDRLNSCFKSLVATLDIIFSQIEPFLLDDTVLKNSLFKSYKIIYSLKDDDIDFTKIDDQDDFAYDYFLSLQKMRDNFIFSRFSNFAPYSLLLKNNVDKALEKYEKLNQKNNLLEYEKLLINLFSENREYQILDSACDTSVSDKLFTLLSGIQEFVIAFSISSIFFCSIFAIYNFIISIDTVVTLNAPWYLGFLCAGLCSVFGAITLVSHTFIPNKHLTREERQNFSNILISKSVKNFSFVIFLLSVAVSLFFAVMIMISNVRFYKDVIKFDNRSYDYNQINSVFYIEARYNVYGDRIERASYVILFNDRTSLDLDGYTSVEFTEKEVLPFLKNKGFDVNVVDSERDLPWYSQTE